MKNLTVSMDEETFAEARVKAAKAGKSMSKYMADLVKCDVETGTAATTRDAQVDALERVLNGPKWAILHEGRMPTADERNAR